MPVFRDDAKAKDRARKLRRVSATVTLAGILGALAWDVVPYLNPAKGDTISEVVRDWSRTWIVLPVFLGAVAGHWFWTWPVPVRDFESRAVALVLVLACTLIVSLVAFVVGLRFPPLARTAAFGLGFIAGHYLWPLWEGVPR